MADYFTQFSVTIDTPKAKERNWLRKEILDRAEYDKHEDSTLDCEWTFQDGGLWLRGDENPNLEAVASLIHDFLRKFNRKEPVTVTWASFCSKLRDGEQTGGGIFITAESIHWSTPEDFFSEERKKRVTAMLEKAKAERKGSRQR